MRVLLPDSDVPLCGCVDAEPEQGTAELYAGLLESEFVTDPLGPEDTGSVPFVMLHANMFERQLDEKVTSRNRWCYDAKFLQRHLINYRVL